MCRAPQIWGFKMLDFASRPPIDLIVDYNKLEGLFLELRRRDNGEELCHLPLRRTNTELMCETILKEWPKDASLGEDGKPTRVQQRHWIGHLIVPQRENCEICERSHAPRFSAKRTAPRVPSHEKTIVKKGATRGATRVATRSAHDLGF
jgi:hypothetical protein